MPLSRVIPFRMAERHRLPQQLMLVDATGPRPDLQRRGDTQRHLTHPKDCLILNLWLPLPLRKAGAVHPTVAICPARGRYPVCPRKTRDLILGGLRALCALLRGLRNRARGQGLQTHRCLRLLIPMSSLPREKYASQQSRLGNPLVPTHFKGFDIQSYSS